MDPRKTPDDLYPLPSFLPYAPGQQEARPGSVARQRGRWQGLQVILALLFLAFGMPFLTCWIWAALTSRL